MAHRHRRGRASLTEIDPTTLIRSSPQSGPSGIHRDVGALRPRSRGNERKEAHSIGMFSLQVDRMAKPTTSDYTRGALYGLAAVCIWAGFIVVSRLGVRTSLTPWDVAAIRFAVAGLLLLPYALKKGLALDRLGWLGVAAIVTGCGAPMVLLVNSGLLFAPAAHAGALFPGVMPLMVAILAAVILKEGFTLQKSVGLALIAAGAVGIVGGTGRDRHRAERRPRAVSRGGAGLGRLHGRHAARAARRPPCRHHRRGRLARALSAGLRVDRGRPRLQRAALRYCASGRGAGRADRHRGAAPLWTHGRPARRHAARLSSPSLRQ